MRPGSVVVDLAAPSGGNCEVTRPNEAVDHEQVTILGFTDLPSRLARQSSQLLSSNIFNLLEDVLVLRNSFILDPADPLIGGMTPIFKGQSRELTKVTVQAQSQPRPSLAASSPTRGGQSSSGYAQEDLNPDGKSSAWSDCHPTVWALLQALCLGLAGILLIALGEGVSVGFANQVQSLACSGCISFLRR